MSFSTDTFKEKMDKSLENLAKISWNDGFFRKDIGWKAIKKNENN